MRSKIAVTDGSSSTTPLSCSQGRIDSPLSSMKPMPASPAENRTPYQPNQYVTAIRLLEILFEEGSRPSMRWLRSLTAAKKVPFVKLSGKILFKVSEVESFLAAKGAVRR